MAAKAPVASMMQAHRNIFPIFVDLLQVLGQPRRKLITGGFCQEFPHASFVPSFVAEHALYAVWPSGPSRELPRMPRACGFDCALWLLPDEAREFLSALQRPGARIIWATQHALESGLSGGPKPHAGLVAAVRGALALVGALCWLLTPRWPGAECGVVEDRLWLPRELLDTLC